MLVKKDWQRQAYYKDIVMVSNTTQEKSFPFVPILLTLGATTGLSALAVRFYRRPYETLIDVARAGMLLSGVREETIDAGGLPMHFYCAGRRRTPVVLVHGLSSSAGTLVTLSWLPGQE